MNLPYIDLHTHTCLSDGILRPEALVAEAERRGVGILAITDHNRPARLEELQAAHPLLRLIQGSELTCIYTDDDGVEHELHMVALGFDPEHPAMKAVFAANQPDRRPYINAILAKLAALNIFVGDYDELEAAAGESTHFGRMLIAQRMVERGYVRSIDEAFDTYLGVHGKKLAYVPNPLRYVSLEQATAAVIAAGGIAVLAHLYYYCLTEEGYRRLLARFKELTGDRGAMETHYSIYDQATRAGLTALAQEFDLMESCASDYHGQNPEEHLDHRFPAAVCAPLLAKLS